MHCQHAKVALLGHSSFRFHMLFPHIGDLFTWHFITRLGEAQYLLPAALWSCLALLRHDSTRSLAYRWLQTLLAATILTTASKIAFIGWGLGIAQWNFTGVSGHAMFASAVFPLLVATLTSRLPPGWQKMAVVFSFALVIAIGISRLMVGAHSVSEVLAGLLLGSAASAFAMAHVGLPRATLNFYVPLVVVVWLVVAPLQAPQYQTHSLVTRLALLLSGHEKPYTRSEMMRKSLAGSLSSCSEVSG
jgi:membrane-associated phospholipid phosphatase